LLSNVCEQVNIVTKELFLLLSSSLTSWSLAVDWSYRSAPRATTSHWSRWTN